MEVLGVVEVLRRLGGTATAAQLQARVPRRAVESAVPAGEARRLWRGCCGLPGFRPQEPIELTSGTIHADLADHASPTTLEADSSARHGSRSALERDCRCCDEAVRSGWVVLRAAWEHVMSEQDRLTGLVRDVVALRCAGRGGPRVPRAGESRSVSRRVLPVGAEGSPQNSTVAKVPTWRNPTEA